MMMLAVSGSVESPVRRLALWNLWASAGRSSESSTITWDGLQWDDEFDCVFVEIIQTKSVKVKLIAFVAGTDRHCCFFLFLADFLTLHAPSIYNDDKPAWMIPELH